MPERVKVGGATYWLNSDLKETLDVLKKFPEEKFDNFGVIDGMEGYGKTTLGVTILHYLTEGQFSVDDIIFTPEQFEEWIHHKDRKPGDACLWDEFVLTGMSQDALSLIQKKIIKYMTLLRKKRFHVILIIPYIFMLRKYFAVARARYLIHVQPKDGDPLLRGGFRFYNYKQKRQVYVRGLKVWEYLAKPTYGGLFGNPPKKLIDWEAYEAKKDEAIKSIDEENAPTRVKQLQQHRALLISYLKERWGCTDTELANLIGVTRQTVSSAAKSVKE